MPPASAFLLIGINLFNHESIRGFGRYAIVLDGLRFKEKTNRMVAKTLLPCRVNAENHPAQAFSLLARLDWSVNCNEEFGIRREPSMQCANPDCRKPAGDLSTGVLTLLELDVPPEKRVIRSDGGFPVCSVPSRYFWLCAKCSGSLKVRRWTTTGLMLEDRATGKMSEGKDRLFPFAKPASRTPLTVTRRTA